MWQVRVLVKTLLRDVIGVTGEDDCKENVDGHRCDRQGCL